MSNNTAKLYHGHILFTLEVPRNLSEQFLTLIAHTSHCIVHRHEQSSQNDQLYIIEIQVLANYQSIFISLFQDWCQKLDLTTSVSNIVLNGAPK